MKKVLKWFSSIIMVGVTIFLTFFLISINSDDIYIDNDPLVLDTTAISLKPESVWINHFSKVKKSGYFYPVNEIYIKIDLIEKITKTITYKLSANLKDPYQLFCLKEELDRFKFKYFLKKDSIGVDLFIYSQNIDKLSNLIKVLKNYKILANIEPYKEEY